MSESGLGPQHNLSGFALAAAVAAWQALHIKKLEGLYDPEKGSSAAIRVTDMMPEPPGTSHSPVYIFIYWGDPVLSSAHQ